MKKLHSLAFYALVPVITFGVASTLAQPSTNAQDTERQHQGAQQRQEQGETPGAPQRDKGNAMNQSESQKAVSRPQGNDQTSVHSRGYLSSAPTQGARVSDIIGATVRMASGENIGSADDLIIDEEGQVVAVLVSIGGFLGIGEKDVAIGWGNVTRSGTTDAPELRINVSRENLRSAPEFDRKN